MRDPVRAALLHERLGRFLIASGSYDAALAAFGTAVDLVPAEPITPQRVHVLAASGHALMLGWRHRESRELCEQALELARRVGARRSEFRALGVLGLVARGYTNRQVAAALVISVKTASVHVSHILAKLQVQNRVEAAAIAHRLAAAP